MSDVVKIPERVYVDARGSYVLQPKADPTHGDCRLPTKRRGFLTYEEWEMVDKIVDEQFKRVAPVASRMLDHRNSDFRGAIFNASDRDKWGPSDERWSKLPKMATVTYSFILGDAEKFRSGRESMAYRPAGSARRVGEAVERYVLDLLANHAGGERELAVLSDAQHAQFIKSIAEIGDSIALGTRGDVDGPCRLYYPMQWDRYLDCDYCPSENPDFSGEPITLRERLKRLGTLIRSLTSVFRADGSFRPLLLWEECLEAWVGCRPTVYQHEDGGEFRVACQLGLKVVRPEGVLRLRLPVSEIRETERLPSKMM